MDDCVVRVSRLSKSYHTSGTVTRVLSEIDLKVHRGECLFLAGPSGSGKTTLLSILGCVLSADSGDIEILGESVAALSRVQQAKFRRERIGFVFQRFHLIDALTAEENIQVPLTLLKWPKATAQAKARELLSLVGLSDKATQRITQMSMGQRQRIAVARALAGDPDLILADEPTASLDEEAGVSAMSVLKQLCASLGKTVIVVTHDSRIFSFADRILHLANGRLVNQEVVVPELHMQQWAVAHQRPAALRTNLR